MSRSLDPAYADRVLPLAAARFASLSEALPVLLVTAAYGWVYVRGVRRLDATPRAVPRWRQACFWVGMGLIVVALLSPLATLAEELFWAHMAEHLLLGDLATLLLVLGLTGPLLAPVLRLPGFGALRTLAHPVVAFGLWAANLYAWHVPALHEAAVRDDAIHALQHLCFIAFGANMWMALLGPLPKPAWFGNAARLVYIFAVRITAGVLGNVFVFGSSVFYDVYRDGERAHDISAGGDQVTAGAVMMVEGSLLTLGLLCWLFLRAARQVDERQELLDAAHSHGVELSEERAARAVSAGRGAELRERLGLDRR